MAKSDAVWSCCSSSSSTPPGWLADCRASAASQQPRRGAACWEGRGAHLPPPSRAPLLNRLRLLSPLQEQIKICLLPPPLDRLRLLATVEEIGSKLRGRHAGPRPKAAPPTILRLAGSTTGIKVRLMAGWAVWARRMWWWDADDGRATWLRRTVTGRVRPRAASPGSRPAAQDRRTPYPARARGSPRADPRAEHWGGADLAGGGGQDPSAPCSVARVPLLLAPSGLLRAAPLVMHGGRSALASRGHGRRRRSSRRGTAAPCPPPHDAFRRPSMGSIGTGREEAAAAHRLELPR